MTSHASKSGGGGGGVSENRKRYLDRSRKSQRIGRNPKRGAPGILMTCETGRERKCRQEGLDILRYYWDILQEKTVGESAPAAAKADAQSLEEELAALKKKKPAADELFGVYETGIRGTVFVLCTLPGCELIPPIQPTAIDGTPRNKKETDKEEGDEEGPATKKPRAEEESGPAATTTISTNHASIANPIWDPFKTVSSIVHDLERSISSPESSQSLVPSSRFVTRMIPMQATCFASLDEIQQTVRALLDQTLAGLLSQKPKDATAPSFCVQIKRRNCSSVTRDDLISAVVAVVDDATAAAPWTVNLREADYTFQIEICKTLTGVSILPASFSKEQRNFNLAEIREKVGVAAE